MPIIAGGIGSGLDIGGLVSQLVAAEAEPVNARLNRQETNFGSELSAFGTLKSALSAFQTSVTNLEKASTFQVYTPTSSNESVFTASTDNTAVAGNYSIEVVQLAHAEKLRSIDFTTSSEVVGTGTLDISLGASTFQLTIDSSNNTLTGIRDAINAATNNPGISASLISVDTGTQLILTSNEVGASNNISITAVDDAPTDGFDLTRLDSANLLTLQSASDAIIKVDSQTVTRNSNSFSDVLSGVTFNLVSAQAGVQQTLSVVSDTQKIKNDIQSFVTNYNTLVGVMKGLSNYDISTKVASPLNGDSVVRGIEGSLRQARSSIVSGAFSNLSSLGITLGKSGSLTIDDVALDANIANNLSDVKQFFSSPNGMAQTFSSAISGYVDNNGIIDIRRDGLQSRLDGIDDKRTTLDRRMTALEARLNAQFTAMDILVAQLKSTGDFLTQQLKNLPTINPR
jgi:flagellar hook-associated protein 2